MWQQVRAVRILGLIHFPIPQGKATKLATNDYIRDKLTASGHGHVSVLGKNFERPFRNVTCILLIGEVIAGACAGFSNVLFSNPLEMLKIRLQCAGWTFSLVCAFKTYLMSNLIFVGEHTTATPETASSLYRQVKGQNIVHIDPTPLPAWSSLYDNWLDSLHSSRCPLLCHLFPLLCTS